MSDTEDEVVYEDVPVASAGIPATLKPDLKNTIFKCNFNDGQAFKSFLKMLRSYTDNLPVEISDDGLLIDFKNKANTLHVYLPVKPGDMYEFKFNPKMTGDDEIITNRSFVVGIDLNSFYQNNSKAKAKTSIILLTDVNEEKPRLFSGIYETKAQGTPIFKHITLKMPVKQINHMDEINVESPNVTISSPLLFDRFNEASKLKSSVLFEIYPAGMRVTGINALGNRDGEGIAFGEIIETYTEVVPRVIAGVVKGQKIVERKYVPFTVKIAEKDVKILMQIAKICPDAPVKIYCNSNGKCTLIIHVGFVAQAKLTLFGRQ